MFMAAVIYLPSWHPTLMKSESWTHGRCLEDGDEEFPQRLATSGPFSIGRRQRHPSLLPEGLGEMMQLPGNFH
jgi:hypothetical protein